MQLVVKSQIEISYMFDGTKFQAQTRFSCPVTNSFKLLKSNPCQVVIDDTSSQLRLRSSLGPCQPLFFRAFFVMKAEKSVLNSDSLKVGWPP